MLIVNLNGGLGNQLFQYAMARDLAAKKGVELKLDAVSGFDGDRYERRYALGPFKITAPLATPDEIRRLATLWRPRELWRVWRKLQPYYWRHILKEQPPKQFHYDPNVLRCRRNAYIFGFWQDERYFADSAETIRREFTLREPPSPQTYEIADRIAAGPAVCVHVRRLHGISATGANYYEQDVKTFGSPALEYYRRAAEIVAAAAPDSQAFVFSDDPAWAQANLRLPFPMTFVTHNGPYEAHEDLHLMSLCRHFIIANSTLSWWGAWLGRAAGKIVCAPRAWMTDRDVSGSGLFPPDWKVL